MDDTGFWLLMSPILLGDPAAAIPGVACGLIVRRWWQVALGLVAAPFASWIYDWTFPNDFSLDLLFYGVSSLIWTAATFAVKRSWVS